MIGVSFATKSVLCSWIGSGHRNEWRLSKPTDYHQGSGSTTEATKCRGQLCVKFASSRISDDIGGALE